MWTPARHEPTALDEAMCLAMRAAVFPTLSFPGVAPDRDGVCAFALPEGRVLRVRLKAEPVEKTTFGVRAAAIYAVSGQALIDREAFSVDGQATVDIATRAFLALEHRMEPLGRRTA